MIDKMCDTDLEEGGEDVAVAASQKDEGQESGESTIEHRRTHLS